MGSFVSLLTEDDRKLLVREQFFGAPCGKAWVGLASQLNSIYFKSDELENARELVASNWLTHFEASVDFNLDQWWRKVIGATFVYSGNYLEPWLPPGHALEIAEFLQLSELFLEGLQRGRETGLPPWNDNDKYHAALVIDFTNLIMAAKVLQQMKFLELRILTS